MAMRTIKTIDAPGRFTLEEAFEAARSLQVQGARLPIRSTSPSSDFMAPRTIKPAAVKAPTVDQKVVKTLAKALSEPKASKKGVTSKTVKKPALSAAKPSFS